MISIVDSRFRSHIGQIPRAPFFVFFFKVIVTCLQVLLLFVTLGKLNGCRGDMY